MSIASEWGRQKTAKPPKTGAPVTQADAIMRRVLAAVEDGDDLGDASQRLMEGVARVRVAFRRRVSVAVWNSDAMTGRKTFDELPCRWVEAGYRGHVVASVSDGRSLVKLDVVGDTVMARLGEDCVRLRWWHRAYDWIMRRG